MNGSVLRWINLKMDTYRWNDDWSCSDSNI